MGLTTVSSKNSSGEVHRTPAHDGVRLLQIAEIALASARMCGWDWDMIANETTFLGDPHPIFGCVPAAGYNEGIRALIHPDDIEAVERNIRRLASSGHSYEEEFRVVHPDGSVHWVYARGRFIHDSSGRPVHLIGVNVDVTDQKARDNELAQARAAAQKQHELLDSIVSNIPAMLCYMREPGKVHWVNRAWEKVLGWTPEDNGGDLSVLLYPDPAEAARARDFIARADGSVGEFRTHTKSGRVIDTAWLNINLPDGTNLGIGRDFSEQKKVMSELRESERRFRMISDNIPQIVWITDGTGQTTYFNQRWYQYTGMSAKESLGHGWRSVLHPDEVVSNDSRWIQAARDGTEFENELRLRRHDGEFRWFLVRAIPMRMSRARLRIGSVARRTSPSRSLPRRRCCAQRSLPWRAASPHPLRTRSTIP